MSNTKEQVDQDMRPTEEQKASAGQIAGIKQLVTRLGYEVLGGEYNLGFFDPNGHVHEYESLKESEAHMLLDVLTKTHRATIVPQTPVPQDIMDTDSMSGNLLRTLQAQARPFAATGAYTITIDDVPPPESDFLTPSDLVLVHFYVLSGEKHASKFDNGKKQVAEYRVLLVDRPDMGVKSLSLGSDFALKQFDELAGKDYPFLASVRKAMEAPYPNKPCILCEAVGVSRAYVPSPKEDKSSS